MTLPDPFFKLFERGRHQENGNCRGHDFFDAFCPLYIYFDYHVRAVLQGTGDFILEYAIIIIVDTVPFQKLFLLKQLLELLPG